MTRHPYRCDQCGFACATVAEFAAHKRWKHPKQASVKKTAHPATIKTDSPDKAVAIKKKPYRCEMCRYTGATGLELARHVLHEHPKRAAKKRGYKLRQSMCQHIPRPENFSIAGCGIDIYFDHLTFIPDLEDKTLTVEYLDKERVCKKCRKRYKLDSILSKRGRRK